MHVTLNSVQLCTCQYKMFRPIILMGLGEYLHFTFHNIDFKAGLQLWQELVFGTEKSDANAYSIWIFKDPYEYESSFTRSFAVAKRPSDLCVGQQLGDDILPTL